METHFEAIQQAQGEIPREKVMSDLRTLVHDAEELLRATAGDMSDKAKEARSRLSTALENAKVTCHRLEARTAEVARATDRVIRDHPYESMGLAFGVGVLLGVVIGRK